MDNRALKKVKTSIIVFVCVLFLSLFVNRILGTSNFENIYIDALVSRFNIDGEYIKGRVEASLALGKKLNLLDTTVKSLFNEVLQKSSGLDQLYITDSSGKILYSTRSILSHQYIPFMYTKDNAELQREKSPYKYRFLDSEFICIPLFSKDSSLAGNLYMEFSAKAISSYMDTFVYKSLRFGLVLFVLSAIFFVSIVVLIPAKNKKKQENILTICILLLSQILFAFYNYSIYNTAITKIFNENMDKLAVSISDSLENPLKYSKIDHLSDISEYLENRIKGNEECSSVYLVNEKFEVLYSADRISSSKKPIEIIDVTNKDISIKTIPNTLTSPVYIAIKTNRTLINTILRDMALDSGTIILVALIFAFMLKNFFSLRKNSVDLFVLPNQMDESQEETALKLIQISTFLFMFAAFETLSFIPLYIKEVLENTGGKFFNFSAETSQSIPVSSYMVGIMISMFVTLFAMKKLSVRIRYIVMSCIFVAGSFLSVLTSLFYVLTIARLICGFGFGGVLLSTSSLVLEYTSSKTRSAGFGINAAAFAAASITSIPIGGVIVNKLGYQAGIIVSVIFALLFLLFSIFCIPDKKKHQIIETRTNNVSIKQFEKIFFSKHIQTYILFINIPFQIIYWGLFQFLLPLYMSDTLKLSQGNIGRILGIFSVVSLYAVYVSRLADRIKNDKLLIALGAAIAGAVMIFFGIKQGGLFLFLAIMIAMGIDNLFIDSIEEVYLESGKVNDINGENILQSYKLIEKILSIFIPTVTSLVITFLGFNKSMMLIGLYSLAGAIFFFVLVKNERWRKNNV